MSKTIDKGILVLSAFTVDRPRLTFEELSKLTQMPSSTLYRFLNGLLRSGYLVKDPSTSSYGLGPGVLRLGRVAEAALDVRSAAIPWMDRLRDETGETIYLSVRMGASRLCLESREREGRGIKFSIRAGETSPIYAGASGKVLLAYLPDKEAHRILGQAKLEKLTPHTVTDRRAIIRELALIRSRGYHYTEAEYNPGAWGLAAPILNTPGIAAASFSISGPLYAGARKPTVDRLLSLLRAATRDISRRLGYTA